MPKPRKALISLNSTPYYHCISRCVRRAFLCGEDSLTGKNFEHRKQWVVNRLTELSSLFAIDIAAFSVLENHYHLVLRIDRQAVDNWSEAELMERWQQLFSLPVL
ncbi:MAG: transposase, partial [Sedimenticola sp.]